MKIPFYYSDDFLEIQEQDHKNDDYFDHLKKLGFDKDQIAFPYFYNQSGLPFHEIFVLYNEKTNQRFCELWDHLTVPFRFAYHTEKEKLEIISRFLEMVKNMTIIEKNLRDLFKEDEI